jgi:hypothetical protein
VHCTMGRLAAAAITLGGMLSRRGRLAPHVLERLGRHCGVAHRVGDAGVAQEVLQPARVHALGGQGIPPSSAAASIVKGDSQLSSMAEFVVISIGAVQVRVRRG